jgi:hypothetical protein
MGFFEKIGDGLKSVIEAPFKLGSEVVQTVGSLGSQALGAIAPSQSAGFNQGSFSFGSGTTGDSGAWLQRNQGLIIVAVSIVGVVLLASTLKKKSVGRTSRKRKSYSKMTTTEKRSYNLAKARRARKLK